jgi:hypothetical protein
LALAGKGSDKISMQLSIYVKPGFLNAVATGEFSLEEAKRTFLQLLDAVVIHKSKKVLFDGRELAGKPETMERLYYGEFAARSVMKLGERGVSPATQFAYVLREPVRDPRRFGETVAVNRGMNVKTFDNPGDALQWLGITPASKPDAGDA